MKSLRDTIDGGERKLIKMNEYNIGQFHPSLNKHLKWMQYSPVYGKLEFTNEKPDYSSEWNLLSDEQKDEIEDEYSKGLIEWFSKKYSLVFYFAGAYENNEKN